jgi:predicted DNA-binding transcriptional regulator AlpA
VEYATSFAKLSTACNYSRSTLHGMLKKGQIPQRGPQGWRVADVLAAIERNVDPARRKSAPSAPRSAERSVPNAERIEQLGQFPDPDLYRDRADLGDAFARGALYGAHVVAFALPTAIACALIEAGIPAAAATQTHARVRDDARFIVGDVTEALGLTPAGTDDAGPHAPTAFGGFDPCAFPGAV